MKYLVIYERSVEGGGLMPPIFPASALLAQHWMVKELIREAMEFHLEGMRRHGDPIPAPSAITEYITV